MDELQKIDMTCQFVMDFLTAWKQSLPKRTNCSDKEVNMYMLSYAAQKNCRNEPVTITMIEHFISNRLNLCAKTAKERVKSAINAKLFVVESDMFDRRKKNIGVSVDVIEGILSFDTMITALMEVFSAQVGAANALDHSLSAKLRERLHASRSKRPGDAR